MNKLSIPKYMRMLTLAAVSCATMVGCSDWDDHYQDSQSVSTAKATIWENLEANPEQFSQFTTLLKKAGFADTLNTSNTYTVWAPLNNTYNYDSLNTLSVEQLRLQFAENLIANYNYPATGDINESVVLLNKKRKDFIGSGTYKMDGVSVSEPNVLARNGVIHVTDGRLPFYANLYEQLNADVFPIDSVVNFYHKYDTKRLDEAKSTIGPIVHGERSYLDSVFVISNDLFYRFNDLIDQEDSSYSMIVPTNKAWDNVRSRIRQYYNYAPRFTYVQNSATTTTSGRVTVPVSINASYLQDSLVNRMAMLNLFYNNNLYDNPKLKTLQTGEPLVIDSLMSTMGMKLTPEEAALRFEGTVRSNASNGIMWIADSLWENPWLAWCPPIRLTANQLRNRISYSSGANYGVRRVAGPNQNPAVPGKLVENSYFQVTPASSQQNPEVDFHIPNVRSATYEVYIVFVPTNITNVYDTMPKPSKLGIQFGFNNARGTVVEQPTRKSAVVNFLTDSTVVNGVYVASRIDTVHVGTITYPIAYYGTGNYYPYIRIYEQSNRRDNNAFSKTYGINCIMFIPSELDAYMKEHPDYKIFD